VGGQGGGLQGRILDSTQYAETIHAQIEIARRLMNVDLKLANRAVYILACLWVPYASTEIAQELQGEIERVNEAMTGREKNLKKCQESHETTSCPCADFSWELPPHGCIFGAGVEFPGLKWWAKILGDISIRKAGLRTVGEGGL